MSLFHQARLASITYKKVLQTSNIASKAIKHPLNKGSGYGYACGYRNLKTYLYATCDV